MWTVLWTDEYGEDRWKRFETRDLLEEDDDAGPYLDSPDTIVFPPEAEELWIPGDVLLGEYD